MFTQSLSEMEIDGLITRKIFPVIPLKLNTVHLHQVKACDQ